MPHSETGDSQGRKRGRPRSGERIVHLRIPLEIAAHLERLGSGNLEAGALAAILAHVRFEQNLEATVREEREILRSLASTLQTQVKLYESERQRWLGDLLAVAKSQERPGRGPAAEGSG